MEPVSPSRPPKSDPPRIADHELLRQIGRGSYGVVWLARTLTATFRAVKVVSKSNFVDARPFEREFEGILRYEPISRTHPGLVSILHVGHGEDGTSFYYVMELADDLRRGQEIDPSTYTPRMLSTELKGGALPLAETLSIGLTLANTLAYLHDRGLVHRDLKPSNIIFVHGAVKFADIGLVTEISDRGTWVGTEGYLPPEGPGQPGADIYALGKILYEMTTGRSCADFPELPTALPSAERRGTWMELNEIILRACARKPDDRFSSAEELHRRLLALQQESRVSANGPADLSPGSQGTRKGTCLVFPAGPDAETAAHGIGDTLRRAGCQVSLADPPVLNLRWARELERQFQRADFAVLVLTPSAFNDDTTAYAVELAARNRRERGRGFGWVVASTGAVPVLSRSFKIALAGIPLLACPTAQDYTKVGEALLEA